MVIQLQPDESIRLYFLAKEPGDTMAARDASLAWVRNERISRMKLGPLRKIHSEVESIKKARMVINQAE